MVWTPPPDDASKRDDTWQIRVRGIQKTFGVHHVLRGVDIDIARDLRVRAPITIVYPAAVQGPFDPTFSIGPQNVATAGINGRPGWMALFSSHPPITERIEALQQR